VSKEIIHTKSRKELIEIINKENPTQEIQIGDLFFSSTYGVCKILDIFEKKEKHWVESEIYIKYDSIENINDTSEEKHYPHETSINQFLNYHNYKIETSIEEFEDDVENLANGKITGQQLLQKKFNVDPSKQSDSTSLITTSVDILKQKSRELIQQQNFMKSRHKAVENMLERRRRELYEMSAMFQEQIEKVQKLIYQIELYLGIKEELHHLQIGPEASNDIKISFRQRILYMDVECGDPTDGGLDISTIDKFDEYLLKYNDYFKKYNYEIFLPEEKCIVVFKLREKDKNYSSENPLIDLLMKNADKKSYILIRNGENIYRIWTDILIDKKLFPNREEIADLILQIDKSRFDSEKKNIEDRIFSYKLNIILLQGLIERTECFPNEKYSINLFDVKTHEEEKVNFIYDADESRQLPSNIPTFNEWKKKLNEQTEEGSRIYFSNSLFVHAVGYKYQKEEMRDRTFKQLFNYDNSYPNAPSSGVYEIEKEKDEKYTGKEELYFKFVDKQMWKYSNTRDKRYSFLIDPIEDTDYYINFDAITLHDLDILEFYLHTRIGRSEYMEYMSMLQEIYKLRKEELKKEGEFVKLVCATVNEDFNEENEKKIREFIVWWKLKNKWKRSLDKDNAKALRMIVRKFSKLEA